MKRSVLLAWALAFLLGAKGPKETAAKDAERLQGTWIVVSGQEDGDKYEGEYLKSVRVTFRGDECTFNKPLGIKLFTKAPFKLDPTQEPKAIDFDVAGGAKYLNGIYQLEGDSLRLCIEHIYGDNKRPTEFNAPKGSKRALITLRRQGP